MKPTPTEGASHAPFVLLGLAVLVIAILIARAFLRSRL